VTVRSQLRVNVLVEPTASDGVHVQMHASGGVAVGEVLADATEHPRADVREDVALIEEVRRGDVTAYGVLYARHGGAARRFAASLAGTGVERDDVTAEAFTRILRVLRAGGGPRENFRSYLFTTMRNAVIGWRRRDSAVALVADVPDSWMPGGREDTMGRWLHATVAADAFASLPERWRVVLWRTEVEGESPARIGSDLGMTANSVSALAYRAREGLRRAYLEQYLPTAQQRACRTIVDQLVGWVRNGAPPQKTRRITVHLDVCPSCRELATDLTQLNHTLPSLITPLTVDAPPVAAPLVAAPCPPAPRSPPVPGCPPAGSRR
jgi:RNA polymerase sigma factor (sigma-70 family)